MLSTRRWPTAFTNGNKRSVVPSRVPQSKFPRPRVYFDKNFQYPNTASLSAIVGGRGVAVDAAIVDLETNKNFSNGRKIADILRYVARLRHEGASNILVVEDGFYTDPGCPKDGPSDCLTRRGDRNHYARRRRLASPTSSTARASQAPWLGRRHSSRRAGGRAGALPAEY